jgi:hypothetical protein
MGVRHMRGKRALTAGMTLLGLVALLVAPTAVMAAKPATELDPTLCAPGENTFSLEIDNSFFPLPVGQQWVLQGKEQGRTIGLRITVLNATETFFSGRRAVTTRVIEELEWEDANANGLVDSGENLREVSLNYFAQTQDGTVCYFGEVVDIYEGGVVVSHEGSWRADTRGNAPGIFMPAAPQPGMTFQQEFAPGIAEDRATIVRSGSTTVPAGTFPDTITVRDFNPLDGSRSTKVYARDVGLIRDDTLELISY